MSNLDSISLPDIGIQCTECRTCFRSSSGFLVTIGKKVINSTIGKLENFTIVRTPNVPIG